MKIITHLNDRQLGIELDAVTSGECVRFLSPFHQDCSPNDRYILNNVISGYRPYRGDSDNKMGVTNLDTGKLSYVERSRKVVVLKDAEIFTNEA